MLNALGVTQVATGLGINRGKEEVQDNVVKESYGAEFQRKTFKEIGTVGNVGKWDMRND